MKTGQLVLVTIACMLAVAAIVIVTRKPENTTATHSSAWVKAPIDNAAMKSSTLSRGRAIGALVAAGNAHAIFQQFDSQMARAVPESSITSVLQSTTSIGPISNRISENAGDSGQGLTAYTAVYAQGRGKLRLNIAFDPQGKVAAMELKPL
jgi:hypothetical protein